MSLLRFLLRSHLLLTVFFIVLGIVMYQWPVSRAMRHLQAGREKNDQLIGLSSSEEIQAVWMTVTERDTGKR